MTAPSRIDARMILAAVVAGLAAGVGGVALTLLLHLIQHVAFGYTEATFLEGVERASPARRVSALAIGGLVVGLGWWLLRWRVPSVGSVEESMAGKKLSILPVTAEGSLQIIAVGCGASLGREGAPRLLGGALAGWLAGRFGLDAGQRRTLIACGAGAGLACVYNVPLGGALFTLEILLVSAALSDVIPAVVSAAVATAVAWPLLSDNPIYLVRPAQFHWSALVFAVVIGPFAGGLGTGFNRLAGYARTLAPSGWRLPVATTSVFAALGALAIRYPELLGNGKGPAQLAFDGTLSLLTLVALVLLKPIATAACLASGANGGLLTPALATGALLGTLGGTAWSMVWPGTGNAAFAMIGAAALLATTQRAPLCSIVLVLELTSSGLNLAVPMTLAVAGAMLTARAISPAGGSPASTGQRPVFGGPA